MKVIRIYGSLAKFLGKRKFVADVSTAAEAMRFLVTNFPQLHAHMADRYYQVQVGSYSLDKDELHHPTGSQEIKLIPAITGAGGTVGRILAGVGLIALSFILPGSWAIAGVALNSVAFGIGASLVLGGVASLLSPVQTLSPTFNQNTSASDDPASDPRLSYSFSGIQNTSRQGLPIPICYGKVLVGSIVVSAAIDIEQI